MHALVVDDEPALRTILATMLEEAGHTVDQAAGVTEAMAKLAGGDVDVALCDVKMPDGSGIDLVRQARTVTPETTFVMVTAFASVETAVEAMRAGAYDYVLKPLRKQELLNRLAQVEDLRNLRAENRALRRQVRESSPVFRFTCPAMLEIERLVRKVARTSSTVLITGESGTGKGVLARMIHDQSDRAERPYLAINCSAIPEQLIEAELFGHTKGAFTGADRTRKGLFLEADGGTLLLDEISEMPLHMQSKLLHVIEGKEVRPVGSEQARRVDTRIVAAANRDCAALVEKGLFREDLYFRLSMFQIRIPPLRERQEDLRRLIAFLVRNQNARNPGTQISGIDPDAEETLLAYAWPGNVRQLENVVNRACILADDGVVTLADLPDEILRGTGAHSPLPVVTSGGGTLRDRMRRIEAGIIRQAIDESGGDRRVAAQSLGIGLSSLYRKVEEHDRLGAETARD